jgi:hypothetical protein
MPADVTFRLGRSTYHVCSVAVDGTKLVASTRVMNASVVNTAPETSGLAVRIGEDVQPGAVLGGVTVPAREAEAVNAIVEFPLVTAPASLKDAVFAVGLDGDVNFEVPVLGSGSYHVAQSFDLDKAAQFDGGALRLDAARVQTALDSRQAKDGTYVLELDLDVWNTSDTSLFLGRITSVEVPAGTSVDAGTSGSKDYDLLVPAQSQVHHATLVFELPGNPGGTYMLRVLLNVGPLVLAFDLPLVLFSPS